MGIDNRLKKRRLWALLALAFGLQFLEVDRALGQVRRYQPQSPTVSPYLNLTRLNAGALPNYHSLVRPMQLQRAINQQERDFRNQYAGQLIQLQNDVQRGLVPVSPTGKASGFMISGSRSQFNYSSRYYRGVTPYRRR